MSESTYRSNSAWGCLQIKWFAEQTRERDKKPVNDLNATFTRQFREIEEGQGMNTNCLPLPVEPCDKTATSVTRHPCVYHRVCAAFSLYRHSETACFRSSWQLSAGTIAEPTTTPAFAMRHLTKSRSPPSLAAAQPRRVAEATIFILPCIKQQKMRPGRIPDRIRRDCYPRRASG